MPAAAADVTVSVAVSGWMAEGQAVYVENAGYFTVQSLVSATSVSLRNLGYTGNVAAATVVPTGQNVAPAGIQGTAGSLTGAATGDLTGTYPSPTVDLLKITSAKMSVTGVAADTYGDASNIPQITVDVAGRITAAVEVPGVFSGAPTGAAGPTILSGTYPDPGIQNNAITTAMMSAVGTPGTYGSSTAIPVITTDASGRVSGVTTAALSFTGTYPTATFQNDAGSGWPTGLGGTYATLGALTYTVPTTAAYLLIANLQMNYVSASQTALLQFTNTTTSTEVGDSERTMANDIAVYTPVVLTAVVSLTAGHVIAVQGKRSSGGTVQVTEGVFTVVKLS